MFRADRPDWNVDGRDWPNREASRFVEAGGLTWHVQIMGEGPTLLLLHGTGAATHSWRHLAPLLAAHFRIVAPDLPGHGFTGMPTGSGLSLPGMATLVAKLLRSLGVKADLAAGHSAGAAVLCEMALEGWSRPSSIVSINGALTPIRGAGLFSPLAKLLFLNPLAPHLFSWRAHSPEATRRLLAGTGSDIDAAGIGFYERLFRCPGHVAGTLGMMANWDLASLERRLPQIDVPLLLVAAPRDRAVPPEDARRIARRVDAARLAEVGRGGHLVHEEFAGDILDLIVAEAGRAAPPVPRGGSPQTKLSTSRS